MSTSYSFDENTKKRLAKIRSKTGAASNTEVITNAVALLEMASKEINSTVDIKSSNSVKEVQIT